MNNLHQAKMECKSGSGREPMLLGVKASGAVKGRLLLMTLEQRYRNTSSSNAEITYTFPLPYGPNGGAVLMDVEVEINGKVLKGEVSPKNTARAKYEEAISEGNTSILLERNYDGSFTLELGNLMAGEECKIMIRYAQTLAPEHGQIRMMLPTSIAPRYGNPITQGRLQPHQVPATDALSEYPFDITIMLCDDMAYSNVSSPSHKTSYYRNGHDLIIKLAQRGYLDRDFILIFSNLKYIVSTGVSVTKDSSPKSLVGAMRIAKLRSFDALMKFIYGTVVRSDEHLETRTVITTEFGVSKRVISDAMVTTLREIGKGEMPPHINIGNWLGKDGQYYWAIGIALPVGMN